MLFSAGFAEIVLLSRLLFFHWRAFLDTQPPFVTDCDGESRWVSLAVATRRCSVLSSSRGAHVTTLLLALWLALDVQGTLTCPNPGEVSQQLARLLPETKKTEQAPHAYLSAGEGFVTIELLGAEGGLLADRRLDRSGSCTEMAEAVAVILAAWQARFSPTVSPTVIEPPAPVPAAVVEPAPEISKRPFLFDAGLAALTSIVGSEAAFGAKLEGTLTPLVHGLGFHAAASLSSNHKQTTTDENVTALWIRPALSVGPNLRLQGTSLALDLHGDAVFSLLHIKGSGLSPNASDTTVQFGVAGGTRGLWTWDHVAVWVGADLLGYLGHDNLTVGKDRKGQLPHLEIQASLGIALGRFR